MRKGYRSILLLFSFVGLFASCSSTKYVPEGSFLLDQVHIKADNKDVVTYDLRPYVRQKSNSRWFSAFKTQLYIYSASGRDSTKWMNKLLRRMGEPPVIYRENLTEETERELTKILNNKGYLSCQVTSRKKVKGKKLKVEYQIYTGKPYYVGGLSRKITDARIADLLEADSVRSLLEVGMRLDVDVLDRERGRITNELRNKGYYKFNKEHIVYTVDSIAGKQAVDLTMHLMGQRVSASDTTMHPHNPYTLNKISFVTDYDVLQSSALSSIEVNDSLHYKGIPIYFKDKLYIRPKLLKESLYMQPGELYKELNVDKTYAAFSRYRILKYTNIKFFESQVGGEHTLDGYVLLTKSNPKSVSFEVEGTNSAGDLGAAASVSFQHRNLFHGSEVLTLKFRGAYEMISGLDQTIYQGDNFTEYLAEASLNFPSFLFPFLKQSFRRNIRATSELALKYNFQFRPEFTRTIATASWSYKWNNNSYTNHKFDLVDLSFLYMPWVSDQFKQYTDNSILEYNYKDRLICRMGYSYNYNSAGTSLMNGISKKSSYSVRVNVESAGNLLYAFSKMSHFKKNASDEYTLLNIPFAQYLKGDFDFARNIRLDDRNSVAYHVGVGVAFPYGNAENIPFEKRYFSGGANSVRGWSVRELGPGSFPGDDNFLNQSGDVKLDASVEFRSKLFWKLNGALFVDAGNVWTIKEYKEQPGGVFRFNKFYKQIAVAYGLGFRFDFDLFIVRLDGGMKALNPVYQSGKDRYPIAHPKFSRDFAFHLAVGYPF